MNVAYLKITILVQGTYTPQVIRHDRRTHAMYWEKRGGRKGTQPIVFGTPLAWLWIVTGAWLIGKSRSSDEWHRRGVVFKSAQQRTARHD